MPYKANEARRHRIPRARYRVTNWPALALGLSGVALILARLVVE